MRIPQPWQRRSSGAWYIQVGKKQIPLGRDKKKAEAKANQLLREGALSGGAIPGGGCTVGEIITAHKAWLQKNRAPSTAAVRCYIFDELAAFRSTGALPAHKLTPAIVQAFVDSRPRMRSPSSQNAFISNIVGMMNWAVRFKMIGENPIDKMPKPTPRIRQEFVPADKFAELIDSPKSDEFSDFMRVMLETGARAMEMRKLHSDQYRDGRFVFDREDSKGKKRSRVIFCPPAAREIVERLISENGPGPVFLNTRGEPWTSNGIVHQMTRLKQKLGMPKLCATVLRHSFAHYRLTQGQDPVVVAKLMGHVDTKMLASRYGHLEGSQFLAEKANELTMPLESTKPAVRPTESEPKVMAAGGDMASDRTALN
jgi:integrase/recombinase XerC